MASLCIAHKKKTQFSKIFNYYTEKEGQLANKAGNVHNVTMRCIRATIAVKSNKYYIF